MRDTAPRTQHGTAPFTVGRGSRAFTVLELLIVMSLIAILASITLVVGRSVSERSKIAQAKAEMAVLAAALEQYKQQYGDYPWTPEVPPEGMSDSRWDGGAVLFNALCGILGPRADKPLPARGRSLVELGRFTLWSVDDVRMPSEAASAPSVVLNWFNDPWGQWYYYHYKKGAGDTTWRSKGFLLYSHGPDSRCQVGDAADTGLLDDLPTESGSPENFANNRDNIYHGRD